MGGNEVGAPILHRHPPLSSINFDLDIDPDDRLY